MKKMIKTLGLFLCLSIVFSSFNYAYATTSQPRLSPVDKKLYAKVTIDQEFADDRVLVVLDGSISEINKSHSDDLFSTVSTKKVTDLTKMNNYSSPKESRSTEKVNPVSSQINKENFRQIMLLELPVKSKENVVSVIKKLEKTEGISYVGPDYKLDLEATTSNDSYINQLWAFNRINLKEAWDITTGSSTTYVGVVDTGIASHSDLNENYAGGKNFVNENETANADKNSHGTHVAGTIAAVGNNGTGVTGIGWNVKLMSLRIINTADKNFNSSDLIQAFTYATDNNIMLLNCSLSSKNDNPALKQAIANYPGLAIFAAGNQSQNVDTTPRYPSAYKLSNVISVANLTNTDELNSDSNYGVSTVHLAAPGTGILSCQPSSLCSSIMCANNDAHYSSGYHKKTGTSMATPMVTGVAALIMSIRPDLSPMEIKKLILDNVDPLASLADKCITGGVLNAYKAVRAATEPQTFSGDVNGDGRADVILSRSVNGKRALTTYLGKSDGSFGEPTTTSSTRTFIYSDPAYVGDFNGDGLTDVMVCWSSDDYRQLLVYISKGNGAFYEGANLSSTRKHNLLLYPSTFHVADVNNDGKDDFIVHYQTTSGNCNALVYKGKASSPYFTDATTNALETAIAYGYDEPVYTGDFNGDGYADIALQGAGNGKRNLRVHLGTSSATFSSGGILYSDRTHNQANYPSQNFIADASGDGRDDFVVHWKNDDGKRCNLVYKGKISSPYLAEAVNDNLISTNNYVDSDPVFIGDINGDGKDDMVVQWANSDGKRQLLTYTATTNAFYNTGVNYSTTNSQDPTQYAGTFLVADVNGDGRDDFIVKWKSSDGMVRLMCYRGTTAGSFLAAVKTTPSTNVPYYIAS